MIILSVDGSSITNRGKKCVRNDVGFGEAERRRGPEDRDALGIEPIVAPRWEHERPRRRSFFIFTRCKCVYYYIFPSSKKWRRGVKRSIRWLSFDNKAK